MAENYLDILAKTIHNNWDAPALTDFYLTEDGSAQDTSRGNHYTYGEMYTEICRVANLLTSLGLQKGDHIAICGANSAHWVIAYLAIAKMQGVSVTVMHTLMPDEIARLVDFSDAKALFAEPDIWTEISPRLGRGDGGEVIVALSLSDWSLLDGRSDRAMTERRAREERGISFPKTAPDDLAMICFTSGTSGNPKGVMLGYGDLTARVIGTNDACGNLNGKNALAFLPLAHIYSFGGQMLTPIVNGGHIYLVRMFFANALFKIVTIVRPYSFFSVPSIVNKLVENPNYKKIIPNLLDGIEYLPLGGAQIPPDVEKELTLLSIPVAPAYGLSESCPISMTPYHGYKKGTVGRVFYALEVRISPAGEILVKGENVMLGYYKDPEATARKIDSDGWLHTGDKGHLDEDGYLYVEGRLEQDMIVLPNGENIHPEDIECKINALSEVSESIVLARDGRLIAIVVPTTSSSLSSASSTSVASLRRYILRSVNPQLPLYSQLYDVEITDTPLAKTEKQTIKRYLYK